MTHDENELMPRKLSVPIGQVRLEFALILPRNMVDIKSAMPPHLFEINAFRGIKTLARNVLVALSLGYTVVVVDEWLNSWCHRAGLPESCLSPIIWIL